MRSTRLTMPALLAGLVVAPALLLPATASAGDAGGNGNPTNDCPNGRTVASAPVVYDGQTVGLVELRWSATCSGNWTRTTSYIGSRSLHSEVFVEASPSSNATAFDTATSHFTPYLHVSASTRVCSYGQINVGGVTARDAQVCSN